MDEAKASWNTVYLDGNGFECQLTLRDEDEESLARRVSAITANVLSAGGRPVVRRSGRSGQARAEGGQPGSDGNGGAGEEKTYLDVNGQRRCNLRRRDGARCGQPVTEREGRYGLFWSCPDYREHAQTARA